MIPIPGTRHLERLEENAASVEIELTDDELSRLEGIAPKGVAVGPRYPEAGLELVGR